MDDWKCYFPEDGETTGDAHSIKPKPWQRIFDAEDAARIACEMEFDNGGWERTPDTEFQFVVVSPDGEETRWTGAHVPSVDHIVREAQ